jgi:DNA-binding response OmpR family regulator
MLTGTVLIVDGDAQRLGITSRVLRTCGYRTAEASCADVALALAEREAPDLVLFRVGLGVDLFHKLAAMMEASGAFMVVFIEPSFSSEHRSLVLSLKAAAFLNAELPQDELIASISALIRQKQVIDELKRSIPLPSAPGSVQEGADGIGAAASPAHHSKTRNKSSPLRDRSPELYQALLFRYEEAVKHVLQHRIYKSNADVFEPFRQIAGELFQAHATARDALELHYQTLRRIAPAPDAPRAQAYLEVGRTTIIGLMGDLLTCYRDASRNNAFESKCHPNGMKTQWSEHDEYQHNQ